MRRVILIAAAALAAGACKRTTGSVVVPSLSRPGPIAFACYSKSQAAFRPSLSACAGVIGASNEDLRVISFALESTRGEVAVIDWHDVRAVDSDRTVPGATFVRVGEVPSAIVIPLTDSRMTFIANAGSYSVQSIETASFVPDAIQDTTGALVPTTITLAGAPTDLEYVDTGAGAFLFAAVPDLGAIAQIPVGADGSLGTPTMIVATSAIPAQVTAGAEPEYVRVCPADAYVRKASVSPRVPRSLGAAPRPTDLALALRSGGVVELLASDAALPFVHRFDVTPAGLAETAGYATAVPTLELTVTPLVPGTHTPFGTVEVADQQFLYAIDALDRSVLVVDMNTSAVLAVNVGDRAADRIPYESGAIALETVTPGYDLAAAPFASRCDPASASRRSYVSPAALRGVFVAASLTDGSVGFIDVYDLDAQCRGAVSDCGGAGNANDLFVYEHRHRPRIGTLVISAPAVGSSLRLSYASGSGALTSTGAASSGNGPGLLPVDDGDPATQFCPGTNSAVRGQMVAALTSTGDPATVGEPLLCFLDDPASIRTQRWSATWEGLVPTAQGVRGTMVDGGPGARTFVTEDGDFCGWGVLGSNDVVAAGLGALDPEFGYGGDMLVVTAPVPTSLSTDPLCAELVVPTTGTPRIRIAFAIDSAFGDHLVLGDFIPDASITIPSYLNSNPTLAFARVVGCIPGIVSYEVRSRAAYTVAGTLSLPRHRVLEDGGGACTIDVAGHPFDPAMPDTARAFRALPGRNFIHPQVAFRISSFAGLLSGQTAQFLLDVVNVPVPLRIDSGFLGVTVRYNPADERFYAVDAPTHAVTQFDLDPITTLNRVQ